MLIWCKRDPDSNLIWKGFWLSAPPSIGIWNTVKGTSQPNHAGNRWFLWSFLEKAMQCKFVKVFVLYPTTNIVKFFLFHFHPLLPLICITCCNIVKMKIMDYHHQTSPDRAINNRKPKICFNCVWVAIALPTFIVKKQLDDDCHMFKQNRPEKCFLSTQKCL